MICDGINLIAPLRTRPKRVIEVLVKMEMNEGQKLWDAFASICRIAGGVENDYQNHCGSYKNVVERKDVFQNVTDNRQLHDCPNDADNHVRFKLQLLSI